ncbi:MAG: alpha/beta fold hydrolase [Bacteroidetes bacterium]|nr:alpha/beta fold hydrolase [Bacteroidota bacterium]
MKLFFREFGKGKPLLILHGLFGFSDNWVTHAKRLANYYRVILVDLRNHGHSPWSSEFSYELMAEDVEELVNQLELSNVILLGHSMGGKVAMRYAQLFPERLDKLVVVDMGVKEYPPHHQQILLAINSLELSEIKARREAEKHFLNYLADKGIIHFLLKNLYWREKGILDWRMNYRVLEIAMPEILSEIPFCESWVPTLFIRGELSDYILDEDIGKLESYFLDSCLVIIPRAGHWVHSDQQEIFLNEVLSFCLR